MYFSGGGLFGFLFENNYRTQTSRLRGLTQSQGLLIYYKTCPVTSLLGGNTINGWARASPQPFERNLSREPHRKVCSIRSYLYLNGQHTQ